jgi:hypothetical protein
VEKKDQYKITLTLKGGLFRSKTYVIKKENEHSVPESLQEALERISKIIEGRIVYRAIETTRERLNTANWGIHWSGSL